MENTVEDCKSDTESSSFAFNFNMDFLCQPHSNLNSNYLVKHEIILLDSK